MGATLHTPVPGRDVDEFDEFCDHLVVREDDDRRDRRLLPDAAAGAGRGRRDALLRDRVRPEPSLADLRGALVETGRSCVHPDHRTGAVVSLVWAGIARYMLLSGHRWLAGCASVPLADGGALRRGRVETVRRQALRAAGVPRPAAAARGRPTRSRAAPARVVLPPLLKGYLRLGAWVCGPPAHDAGLRRRRLLRPAGTRARRPALPEATSSASAAMSGTRGFRASPCGTGLPRARPGADVVVRPGCVGAPDPSVAARVVLRGLLVALPPSCRCCWAGRGRERFGRAIFRAVLLPWAFGSVVSGADGLAGGAGRAACWWSTTTSRGWTSSRSTRVRPMRALAKRDIAVVAGARRAGVRGRARSSWTASGLRSLPGTVAELADALRGGSMVNVTPEGTTWCGLTHGRFRPGDVPGGHRRRRPGAPGRAAVPARGDGTARRRPRSSATETIVASVRRVARLRGLVARGARPARDGPRPRGRPPRAGRPAEAAVDTVLTDPRASRHIRPGGLTLRLQRR